MIRNEIKNFFKRIVFNYRIGTGGALYQFLCHDSREGLCVMHDVHNFLCGIVISQNFESEDVLSDKPCILAKTN